MADVESVLAQACHIGAFRVALLWSEMDLR